MALSSASARRAAPQGPECPRCAQPLQALSPGRAELWCAVCRLRFHAAVFDPPPVRTAGSRPVEAAASAPCARHARNLAVATCERCGAFMCSLCRIDADGMALCAACFERLGSQGQLADTRRSYRHYNGMALHLALGGMLFWPFAVVLGPLAMLTARRGIKQSGRLGEDLGKRGAYAALVLGGLELVGGAVFAFSLFSGALK